MVGVSGKVKARDLAQRGEKGSQRECGVQVQSKRSRAGFVASRPVSPSMKKKQTLNQTLAEGEHKQTKRWDAVHSVHGRARANGSKATRSFKHQQNTQNGSCCFMHAYIPPPHTNNNTHASNETNESERDEAEVHTYARPFVCSDRKKYPLYSRLPTFSGCTPCYGRSPARC